LVFGPVKWKRKGVWLYRLVKRIGAEADISINIYPHLFRHMKAQ